jgi:hypothetical protein
VQRAFNARLNEHNLAIGTWKAGDTPLDRPLGKELCVLAWAIERLEPEKIRAQLARAAVGGALVAVRHGGHGDWRNSRC